MKRIVLHRSHPGGYKAVINGHDIEIEKQWHSNTWVAQSVDPMPDGSYFDMECETLSRIRHDLSIHAILLQTAN